MLKLSYGDDGRGGEREKEIEGKNGQEEKKKELYLHLYHRLITGACLGSINFVVVASTCGGNSGRKTGRKHNTTKVHRSVQILRDKQELAETQKELAKLQLAQKESQEKNDITITRAVYEPNSLNNKPDDANQQLVLAPPHQTAAAPTVLPAGTSQQVQLYKALPIPQQAPNPPNIQQGHIIMQPGNYYPRHPILPQDQLSQPARPELHYMQPRPQPQDIPFQETPQQQLSENPNQHPQFPQYQQQLPPKHDQQLLQQPASQSQIRTQPPPMYTPYSSQPPVAPGPETFSSSMPMQGPNPTIA